MLEPVGKYEGRIIGVFQMEDFENLLAGGSMTSTYWFLDDSGTCHSIDCTWNDLIIDPEMRYSEVKTVVLPHGHPWSTRRCTTAQR